MVSLSEGLEVNHVAESEALTMILNPGKDGASVEIQLIPIQDEDGEELEVDGEETEREREKLWREFCWALSTTSLPRQDPWITWWEEEEGLEWEEVEWRWEEIEWWRSWYRWQLSRLLVSNVTKCSQKISLKETEREGWEWRERKNYGIERERKRCGMQVNMIWKT